MAAVVAAIANIRAGFPDPVGEEDEREQEEDEGEADDVGFGAGQVAEGALRRGNQCDARRGASGHQVERYAEAAISLRSARVVS